MKYWLILIPLITAFATWFTLWLFFRIIFHPRQPRRILGVTFQGIFPRRQAAWAAQLGKLVSTQFFSFDKIEQKISDPLAFEKVTPMIESHVDDFLRNKLKEQMPMISMFIGDKTIQSLKTVFMKEITSLFPQVMKQFAGSLKNELDIEQIVTSRINSLKPEELECTISQAMAKEIRMTGWMAACIGFFAGMIQLLIIWLAY